MYRVAHQLVESIPAPVRRFLPSTVRGWVRQVLRRRAFKDLKTVEMCFKQLRFDMLAPRDSRYRWQDYDQNGCHEPKTTGAFLWFLDAVKDPIVWDVGSYCGYFAMVSLEAEGCEAVHVIEPRSTQTTAIKANLDARPEALVHPKVLGATPEDGLTGDKLGEDHGMPDIIKIDVDGGEAAVLEGMERVLTTQPYLLVEIHYLDNYRSIRRAIISALDSRTYEFFLCERQRDPDSRWRHLDSLQDLPETAPNGLNDSMIAAIPSKRSIKSFPS